MADDKPTAMQMKILELLSDGKVHTKAEIREACDCSYNSVQVHISTLRSLLRRVGQDILCVDRGTGGPRYIRVRMLSSPHDGVI